MKKLEDEKDTIYNYWVFYSFSQTDTTIKLIPNWKKGEIQKYEKRNYSTVDAEGERKINGLTTKTITIQIVDVNEKLLELNWKVDQLVFSDTINSDNPFSGLTNTLDKDVFVKYTRNKNGNIIRILNLDEISKTVKSRIDTMRKDFIKKNDIEKSKAEMLNFQFSMTNRTTIIPDNIFAPNENGRPSNILELKCSNFDKRIKSILLKGN